MPWIGGLIGAVAGPVIGGLIGSDASRSAANTQSDAAREATALQKEMFDKGVELNRPYTEAGYASLNRLNELLGIGGNAGAAGYGTYGRVPTSAEIMSQDPGYQFGLDQSLNALKNYLSAQGLKGSGAEAKSLTQLAGNYATQRYGSAFDRWMQAQNSIWGRLGDITRTGQASANNTAAAGGAFGRDAASNLMSGAQARSDNALAQGGIWTNAFNQGVSAWNNRPQGTVPVSTGGVPDYVYGLQQGNWD